MARYQATIASRRSVRDTFDYLATFSNAAHWDPGVLASEQLDGGQVKAGTRFRLQVRLAGRSIPLTYTVTSYRPDSEFVLTAASRMLRSTDRITVAPAPAGATVNYTADVQLSGPLGVLDPLLNRGFQTVGGRAAAGLARVLSSSPENNDHDF